jgi:hypothetical protein
VGEAAVAYRSRAVAASSALLDTLRAAAEHAAAVAAWEAALPAAALTPSGAWAQVEVGWPAPGPPAGGPAPALTDSSFDTPGYLAPKHAGGAVFIGVDAGGVPVGAPGAGAEAAHAPLTPHSPSAAPIASLEASTAALAALPPLAWAQLRYVRRSASLPAVVFGALCVLLGVAEPGWHAAMTLVGDAALPARCVAAAGAAWRAARAVADARDGGGGGGPLEPDLAAAVAAAALAAKLLRKRPDSRAEAAAARLVVRAAPGTVLATAVGGGELFVAAPLPALSALLEWLLALVHAVGEGATWDDQREAPPKRVLL